MELSILDLIQKLHTPIGDQVMCAITKLGNGGTVWIVLTLVLLLALKTRRCGAALAVALVINTILCNGILKPLVARPRPCDVNTAIQLLVPRPSDWSFPSGHTSASFASATALFFHAYHGGAAAVSESRAVARKLWKPALLLAFLIAFSRLYLYVHYPTDVLGGMLLGCLSGCAGCRFMACGQEESSMKDAIFNPSGRRSSARFWSPHNRNSRQPCRCCGSHHLRREYRLFSRKYHLRLQNQGWSGKSD